MTDSTQVRRPATENPPRRIGTRGTYRPSAQVVAELARLGSDLSTVAGELRACLSEPADDVRR